MREADSEQDAAIYLTAAFTGLRRGELVALRWRDVDFAAHRIRVCGSYAGGQLTTPKSGKVRSVPLAPAVAEALARLGQRELFTDEDDLVFPGIVGRLPRRVRARAPLPGGAAARRPPAAALPRPAPHVRHAHDRQGRHPPRAGVDGPRRRRDDDEVPPLRRAPGRGAPGRRGLLARDPRNEKTASAGGLSELSAARPRTFSPLSRAWRVPAHHSSRPKLSRRRSLASSCAAERLRPSRKASAGRHVPSPFGANSALSRASRVT